MASIRLTTNSPQFKNVLDVEDELEDFSEEDVNTRLEKAINIPMSNLTLDEVDDRITELEDDPIIKNAVEQGTDLRQLSKQVEGELEELQEEHIKDYIGQAHAMAELHGEIKACDDILQNMEQLLGGFQQELGNISKEIQSLQDSSTIMNTQLQNRMVAQGQLSAFIDKTVVSPELIYKICEGEINEDWIRHLKDLNSKMIFIRQHYGKPIQVFRHVIPELERLRLKACDRIREFLIEKIRALRNPSANIAIIQQNVLLKYKECYWFLLERHAEAATEVRAVYVNTVGNYYYSLFDKYAKSIAKFQAPGPDVSSLIGSVTEETGVSMVDFLPTFGLFGSKPTPQPSRTNAYALGDRINLLLQGDAKIIMPHVAETLPTRYPFEALFKSLNRLLLDNASSEYVFTYEFFVSPKSRKAGNSTGGPAMASSIFQETFGPTTQIISTIVKEYLEQTVDAIGVLICVRLNQQHGLIMSHRRIPCLDDYINGINLLLWPKFQSIMDLHGESVRKANASQLMMNHKDTTPHYVLRRYAEFASSILFLNQGYDDALLLNSLTRLRSEVEALLGRMSLEIGDKKKRLIFLINNYDLVSSILSGYSVSSFEGEKTHISAALTGRIVEYVEELLRPYFGGLIRFIAETQAGKVADVTMYETVGKDFAQRWKSSLDDISSMVITSFPNFQNGSRVLQGAVTRLLFYYRQFSDLWDVKFSHQSSPPIGLQTLMIELKRWLAKSSFE